MTQRDIAKDKEMCEAATSGLDMEDGENVVWTYYLENCEPELGDNNIATFKHNKDAVFYIEARDALPYWIAQYEAAQARFEIAFENNVRYIEENERLQARISELETLLHPNNRKDARKPQTHAQMMSDAIDKLASYEREGKR